MTTAPAAHDASVRLEDLPDVLFAEDVAAVYRCSIRTVMRGVERGAIPPPMRAVDKSPRWAKADIAKALKLGHGLASVGRRGRERGARSA